MEEVTKKKRVRGGHRASASKLVAKIGETLQRHEEKDVLWLRQSLTNLKGKIKVIKEIDELIVNLVSAGESENVEELVVREIEGADNAMAEFE